MRSLFRVLIALPLNACNYKGTEKRHRRANDLFIIQHSFSMFYVISSTFFFPRFFVALCFLFLFSYNTRKRLHNFCALRNFFFVRFQTFAPSVIRSTQLRLLQSDRQHANDAKHNELPTKHCRRKTVFFSSTTKRICSERKRNFFFQTILSCIALVLAFQLQSEMLENKESALKKRQV